MKVHLTRAWDRLRALGPNKCLLILGGLLAALLLVQAGRYVAASRRGKGLVESLASQGHPPVKREKTKDLKSYDAITKKTAVGSAAQQGPPRLFGIIGDSALLGTSSTNTKPYKVGTTITGGEKVIEISGDGVILEKDGKRRTLQVFPALKMKPPPTSKPVAANSPKSKPSSEGPPATSGPKAPAKQGP